LTAEQFQLELDEKRSKGLYPISAVAFPDGDKTRFGFVMARNSQRPKWAERHGLTTAQLRKELDAGKSRGYRPTVISGYREGGESRYLAVWVQDTTTDPPTTWTPSDPEADDQGARRGRRAAPVARK
jgi:hypothetical protein